MRDSHGSGSPAPAGGAAGLQSSAGSSSSAAPHSPPARLALIAAEGARSPVDAERAYWREKGYAAASGVSAPQSNPLGESAESTVGSIGREIAAARSAPAPPPPSLGTEPPQTVRELLAQVRPKQLTPPAAAERRGAPDAPTAGGTPTLLEVPRSPTSCRSVSPCAAQQRKDSSPLRQSGAGELSQESSPGRHSTGAAGHAPPTPPGQRLCPRGAAPQQAGSGGRSPSPRDISAIPVPARAASPLRAGVSLALPAAAGRSASRSPQRAPPRSAPPPIVAPTAAAAAAAPEPCRPVVLDLAPPSTYTSGVDFIDSGAGQSAAEACSPKDFASGMRVLHMYRGMGVVQAVDSAGVRVLFHSGDTHTYRQHSLVRGALLPVLAHSASDFRTGERATHEVLGTGVVTTVDADGVRVSFGGACDRLFCESQLEQGELQPLCSPVLTPRRRMSGASSGADQQQSGETLASRRVRRRVSFCRDLELRRADSQIESADPLSPASPPLGGAARPRRISAGSDCTHGELFSTLTLMTPQLLTGPVPTPPAAPAAGAAAGAAPCSQTGAGSGAAVYRAAVLAASVRHRRVGAEEVITAVVRLQRHLRLRIRIRAAVCIQMLVRRRRFERNVQARRPCRWDWLEMKWKQENDNLGWLKLQRQKLVWESDPIFKACLEGDMEGLKRLARRSAGVLRHRDENTATPLLVLVLQSGTNLRARQMALWIIENHPERARDQYTGELFRGQAAVHTAILHRDPELVARLLQAAPNTVLSRAQGTLYSKQNNLFFGEWPLFFAVSTNQPGVVLDILDRSEDAVGKQRERMLGERDSHGNTVFHMCALHGHEDMFAFLVQLANKEPRPTCIANGLHNCRNERGLTPLMLAAAEGPVHMFSYLLESVAEETWRLGPYHHRMIWLDEIEDEYGTDGVLRILVEQGDDTKLEHPLVQEILLWKWDRAFAPLFARRARTVAAYALCFTITNVIPWGARDTAPLEQLWAAVTSGGIRFPDGLLPALALLALDGCVFAGACLKASQELPELLGSGVGAYFGRKGAAQLENVAAFGHCLCMFVSYACRAAHHIWALPTLAVTSHCALAISALLLWLYVLWLIVGFRATGPFVLMILKMVRGDIKLFGGIFVTFLFGFAQAFHILFMNPTPWDFAERLRQCLIALVGDVDWDGFDDPPAYSRALVSALLRLYVVLVTVLLLNLLIAMMSSTYEKVFDEADRVWRLERARIMNSMQAEMGPAAGVWWLTRPSDGRRFLALPNVTEGDVQMYHAQAKPDWPHVRRRAELPPVARTPSAAVHEEQRSSMEGSVRSSMGARRWRSSQSVAGAAVRPLGSFASTALRS